MGRRGWIGLLWQSVVVGVANNDHISDARDWLLSWLLSLALLVHVVVGVGVGVQDENGPDEVRDAAGDGVAFPKLGEGGGIGNGCKVREGVGVPTDWARKGAPPLGTLRKKLRAAPSRGAATGVGAVEETEIGLPVVDATKIGLLAVDATKMGAFSDPILPGPVAVARSRAGSSRVAIAGSS